MNKHKAGFVNIIGKPNAGKSTLMNALVGEKLSIITPKAQTTRHRIMGIVNGENFQIVYSDTPGIIKPGYKLQESMMHFVEGAYKDADLILLVIDIAEKNHDQAVLEKLIKLEVPILVLLNKIDLTTQQELEKLVEQWKQYLPKAEVIPISALSKFNLQTVLDSILRHLPEAPPFFPKDELTDKSQRFFVSEIIREKILLYYQKEIPYSTEIVIDTFKEEEKIIKIRAEIIVERDSQKAIIIGHQGKAIKKMGIMARKDIEKFLEKHVFLELFVKVNKDWRSKEGELRKFGYL
jgi:GTP-binding protein Era